MGIVPKHYLLGGRKMNIADYLKAEIKRLNRLNDGLEKKINQGNAVNNEPEQIICNVNAMCEIANTIISKIN